MVPFWWVGRTRGLGPGRCRRRWTAPVFRVPDRLSVGGRSTRGAASLRGDVPGPDPRGARPPTRREGPLTTRASLLPLGTDISPLGRKYDHLGPADLGGSDEPVCHRALETSVARACVGQEEECMHDAKFVSRREEKVHANCSRASRTGFAPRRRRILPGSAMGLGAAQRPVPVWLRCCCSLQQEYRVASLSGSSAGSSAGINCFDLLK